MAAMRAFLLLGVAHAYKNNFVDTRYQPIFRPPGVGAVGYTGDPNGMMYRADTKTYHLFWQCKIGEIDGKTLWCHAASKDLATWTRLPYEPAMSYSGGATQTAGGVPKMLYKDVEKGNRFYTATPGNLSDPWLTGWVEAATPTALSPAATDPSSGWPAPDGGFYAVQGQGAAASLWKSDAAFEVFESQNRSLLSFDWDFNPKDPTPRDPNFFNVGDAWAFEGSQKMCFWGGHDFYTLGAWNGTHFAPDDPLLSQTSPADYGGELWASNTFAGADGAVLTMAWVLEGDCDVEAWPPQKACQRVLDRGWYGVLTVIREVTLRSVALPGGGAQRALAYAPVEALASLRFNAERVALAGDGKFHPLKTAGAALDVSLTAAVGTDVAVRVLASPDGEERTVVSLTSAKRIDHAELVYLNAAQQKKATLNATAAASIDACEARCLSDARCLGWTATPVSEGAVACRTLGRLVPLLTKTKEGCDWGKNLGRDPRDSTSGVKGASWAVLAIDRSASRLSGGYGTHEYAALVPLDGDAATVRVLVDGSVVEAFCAGVAVTARVYPTRDDAVGVAVSATTGATVSVEAHEMRAAF